MWANVLSLTLLALPVFAEAKTEFAGCLDTERGAGAILDASYTIKGTAPQHIPLRISTRQAILVRVIERDIDVFVEVVDATGKVIGQADNPVPRTGVATAYLDTARAMPGALVIRSKEHATHQGSVQVQVFPATTGNQTCASMQRKLAAADASYAAARAQVLPSNENAASAAKEFARTAQLYEHVLASATASEPRERAVTELALANLQYYDLGNWSDSARWATKAASSFASVGDAYFKARAEAVLAAAWLEMGTGSASDHRGTATPSDSRNRFDAARQLLGTLETFHGKRGETYDATLQTNNLGLSYFDESRFEEAIVIFRSAMQSFARLKETPREALSQQNIALCLWGQGRLSDALGEFDEALEKFDLVRRASQSFINNDIYLLTLNNSALAHYSAGQYDKSLRLHELALTVAGEVKNEPYRARSFYGLGVTYYALGDHRLASQLLGQSLAIWTPKVDDRGRVSALRALAVIAAEEKRYEDAAKYNLEALQVAAAPSARTRIKVKLGANYAAMGNTKAALQQFEDVINDASANSILVQAEARLERGRLWRRAANDSAARDEFNRALTGFRAQESVSGEFETLLEIAKLQMAANQLRDARNTLTQALALGGEIGSQTANPEYRASVAQSLRPAQELMLELQRANYERAIGAGNRSTAHQFARESLDFADSTRARAFGQRLLQRFEGRDDAQLNKLLQDRETVSRDLADRRFYLSTREDRAGPDDPRAKVLRADIAGLRVRLGGLETEIAARVAGDPARRGNAKSASLDFGRLPEHRALLEYWVGANAYAWVVTRNGVEWLELGSGAELESEARKLHALMQKFTTTPAKDRTASLAKLHAAVIAPLLPYLAGKQELVIAADGPLHVVPFAALRGANRGDRFLVQDRSLAFVPALRYAPTTPLAVAPAAAPNRMLLVADPVYQPNDERLVAARIPMQPRPSTARIVMRDAVDIASLTRLRATAREATAIRRGMGEGQVELLEGTSATLDELLTKDLSSYRYIHIAGHGIIDTEIPQLSALVLGAYGPRGRVKDQQLNVSDLLTKTFNADVVVLSACNTSLGLEFASEGPISLRYAVLARGARSVVSSLWPVADVITADFMTEMYGGLTNKSYRPEMALTMAMRRLLEQRPALDPALWAPYTIYLAYQQERTRGHEH